MGEGMGHETSAQPRRCSPSPPPVAAAWRSATIRTSMVVTILKLVVVLIFLIMFIRRPNIVWGVGLLTVSTAVLLDTFLGTFNRADVLAQLGFFFYVITGCLFAGAAFWLWGLLRPYMPTPPALATQNAPQLAPLAAAAPAAVAAAPAVAPIPPRAPDAGPDRYAAAGYDRQMLFEQIRTRFGREDLLDLIFDLDLNEMEITGSEPTLDPSIVRLMDAAERAGKEGELALGVERILTPPTPKSLPRLEKLSADSPRPVLRYYLLGNYTVEQLEKLSARVDVDWEQLDGRNKRARVREFLDYLYRRNRVGDLLAQMKSSAA